MDLALIDAGGANLGSVRYAFERLGVAPRIVRDGGQLNGAERVVLPGVGAAAPAMRALRERGFVDALRASTAPLLGVCLGMQLLYEASEEGDSPCLGLLPGTVRRMRAAPGVRIPHMGWNTLHLREECELLSGVQAGASVYFVHGYAAPVDAHTLASATHGDAFAAIVRRDRIVGMQFHPERSSATGARLLRNFLRWRP